MSSAELATLVTAITGLVIALTALLKALPALNLVKDTHAAVAGNTKTIDRIDQATNGALQVQKDLVSALQATQATSVEVAARQTHPAPPSQPPGT